jgi:hypothetical protein
LLSKKIGENPGNLKSKKQQNVVSLHVGGR